MLHNNELILTDYLCTNIFNKWENIQCLSSISFTRVYKTMRLLLRYFVLIDQPNKMLYIDIYLYIVIEE